jgi:hypothetical protein
LVNGDSFSSYAEYLNLARQVVSAVAATHEKGCCHRDVKTENFVFGFDGQLKLVDFGLAFNSPLPPPGDVVAGSPAFMAPEMAFNVLNKEGRRSVGQPADVWSVGIVLFSLLTRHAPYPIPRTSSSTAATNRGNDPHTELMTRVAAGSPVWPKFSDLLAEKRLGPNIVELTQSGKPMIESLLKVEPADRPTLKSVLNSKSWWIGMPSAKPLTDGMSSPFPVPPNVLRFLPSPPSSAQQLEKVPSTSSQGVTSTTASAPTTVEAATVERSSGTIDTTKPLESSPLDTSRLSDERPSVATPGRPSGIDRKELLLAERRSRTALQKLLLCELSAVHGYVRLEEEQDVDWYMLTWRAENEEKYARCTHRLVAAHSLPKGYDSGFMCDRCGEETWPSSSKKFVFFHCRCGLDMCSNCESIDRERRTCKCGKVLPNLSSLAKHQQSLACRQVSPPKEASTTFRKRPREETVEILRLASTSVGPHRAESVILPNTDLRQQIAQHQRAALDLHQRTPLGDLPVRKPASAPAPTEKKKAGAAKGKRMQREEVVDSEFVAEIQMYAATKEEGELHGDAQDDLDEVKEEMYGEEEYNPYAAGGALGNYDGEYAPRDQDSLDGDQDSWEANSLLRELGTVEQKPPRAVQAPVARQRQLGPTSYPHPQTKASRSVQRSRASVQPPPAATAYDTGLSRRQVRSSYKQEEGGKLAAVKKDDDGEDEEEEQEEPYHPLAALKSRRGKGRLARQQQVPTIPVELTEAANPKTLSPEQAMMEHLTKQWAPFDRFLLGNGLGSVGGAKSAPVGPTAAEEDAIINGQWIKYFHYGYELPQFRVQEGAGDPVALCYEIQPYRLGAIFLKHSFTLLYSAVFISVPFPPRVFTIKELDPYGARDRTELINYDQAKQQYPLEVDILKRIAMENASLLKSSRAPGTMTVYRGPVTQETMGFVPSSATNEETVYVRWVKGNPTHHLTIFTLSNGGVQVFCPGYELRWFNEQRKFLVRSDGSCSIVNDATFTSMPIIEEMLHQPLIPVE